MQSPWGRRNHDRLRKLHGGRCSTENKEQRERGEVRVHIMKVPKGADLYFGG